MTATTVFQATLPAPVRVIPRDRTVRAAIALGEHRFVEAGCAECQLPNQNNGELASANCAFLTHKLWGAYSEPGFGHHGQ